MFTGCMKLASWDISLPALTDGDHMFFNCITLTSFTGDLSNLTDGDYMFGGCSDLVNFSSNLSNLTRNILTDHNYMFSGCTALTNVTLNGTLDCDRLTFTGSTKLTVDSLMNIINVLVDRTGQDSYTLRLGATNLNKLSEEQKSVATNKNWILS